MNQRAGKMHKAALGEDDKVRLGDLIKFVQSAKEDLERSGEDDAALRFEILEDWLRNDFRGRLSYSSKVIGL